MSPFDPVYPALHSHEVWVMLPAGETEFDGQAEQFAGPTPALYWLILHCEHAPPFVPVYPELHLHAVISVLYIGEIEFAGHSKQCAMCIDVENLLGTESHLFVQNCRTARLVRVSSPFHCILARDIVLPILLPIPNSPQSVLYQINISLPSSWYALRPSFTVLC